MQATRSVTTAKKQNDKKKKLQKKQDNKVNGCDIPKEMDAEHVFLFALVSWSECCSQRTCPSWFMRPSTQHFFRSPKKQDTATTRGSLRHQDTDGNPMRGDRERWQLAKVAVEHVLHEAPDAGCDGGDCGEPPDATDGIAANGQREDRRETYPFDVPTGAKLLRALRRPHGSKQSCSAMTLETTHRGICEWTRKPRRSRRTQRPNQRTRGLTWSDTGHASRAPGTQCTRKKQRTTSGMHHTISRHSLVARRVLEADSRDAELDLARKAEGQKPISAKAKSSKNGTSKASQPRWVLSDHCQPFCRAEAVLPDDATRPMHHGSLLRVACRRCGDGLQRLGYAGQHQAAAQRHDC